MRTGKRERFLLVNAKGFSVCLFCLKRSSLTWTKLCAHTRRAGAPCLRIFKSELYTGESIEKGFMMSRELQASENAETPALLMQERHFFVQDNMTDK